MVHWLTLTYEAFKIILVLWDFSYVDFFEFGPYGLKSS